MPSGLGNTNALQQSLEERLTAWSDRFGPRFILGLSGGGDSMALALACAKWVATGKGTVHAVCIDHGLRSSSTDEARQTIDWALKLGLTGHFTSLNLQSGPARVQERARQGRHRALCDAAKDNNARIILLAHTADDQRETLCLRLASKTGLDGLAGMSELAPSPFYTDEWPCLLGRPLLRFERADLRDTLTQARQSWHEDPSNSNLAFGRIRARARLALLASLGLDVRALNRIADHALNLRKATDAAARAMLVRADMKMDQDHISLSAGTLRQAAPVVLERGLGWLAFCIGGAPRQPEGSQIMRLRDAIMTPDFKGQTLAGAKFAMRGDRLNVTIAPPRSRSNTPVCPLTSNMDRRLAAISANLDQFVTHLG